MPLTSTQQKEYVQKTKVTRERRLFSNQAKGRSRKSPEINLTMPNEQETQPNEDYAA